MKKKIKDLTLEECKEICCKYKDCSSCPLEISKTPICYLFNQKMCVPEEMLEKEVEVDE